MSATLIATDKAAAVLPYRAVVIGGDTLFPGGAGVISGIRIPAIDNNGGVVFKAFGGGGEAVYTDSPGGLTVVAQTNGPVPPGFPIPITVFRNTGGVIRDGDVAFWAKSFVETGVFTFDHQTQSLNTVARSNGQNAPGTSAQFVEVGRPALGTDGIIVFQGFYETPGVQRGIFVGDSESLQDIARSDGPNVPGTTSSFSTFGAPQDINSSNGVAFSAEYASDTEEGIFFAPSGGILTDIARTDGAVAPGSSSHFGGFGSPDIGDGGHLAFSAFYSGGGGGIFVYGSLTDTLAAVARTDGPSVPGLGVPFDFFIGDPRVNDNGAVVFRASHSVGIGIFSDATGVLSELVRTGADDAPGTSFPFSTFEPPVINSDGIVAFEASVSGGAEGIWASGPSGQLHLVALEGQSWDLDGLPGGESRVIGSLTLVTDNAATNTIRTTLNDSNELVFLLGFTSESGGGSGIFVSTIPEPSTALLAGLGLVALLAYGWRRRRTA